MRLKCVKFLQNLKMTELCLNTHTHTHTHIHTDTHLVEGPLVAVRVADDVIYFGLVLRVGLD